MSDPTNTISSVADAIHALDQIEQDKSFCHDEQCFHKFPFGIWFRGHHQTDWKLEPHVFRTRLRAGAKDPGAWDETNVYEHLKLRVATHQQTYHSAFEWLCLMQHYSVPTRLLDWSESILSALYFSAKDSPKHDGEIIVLNAHRLNARIKPRPTISTPDDYRVIVRAEMAITRSSATLRRSRSLVAAMEEAVPEERLPGRKASRSSFEAWMKIFLRPIAVFPRWLNSRMSLQSSVFTLHGGKCYVPSMRDSYKDVLIPGPISLEDIDDAECAKGTPLLKRFVIPRERKPDIMRGLFRLGVHEGTLFPEVDRQAVYLQQCWWYQDADPFNVSYPNA